MSHWTIGKLFLGICLVSSTSDGLILMIPSGLTKGRSDLGIALGPRWVLELAYMKENDEQ
jgi:hypothetical protein